MIQIIDNVIPKDYQDGLENILFNKEFIKITSPKTSEYSQGNIGHEYWFVRENKKLNLYELIDPLFNEVCSQLKISGVIADARTFLQEISSGSKSYDVIHVDRKCPHLVFLYYVRDSDGDTVLFNKRCDYDDDQFLSEDIELQPVKRISPKKGRILIFDGSIYHATGIPKQKQRCVINFNVFPD